MRKPEVIERLCALVTEVADKEFSNENLAHDCFCGRSLWPGDDQCVAEKIVTFIEAAVRVKMVPPATLSPAAYRNMPMGCQVETYLKVRNLDGRWVDGVVATWRDHCGPRQAHFDLKGNYLGDV